MKQYDFFRFIIFTCKLFPCYLNQKILMITQQIIKRFSMLKLIKVKLQYRFYLILLSFLILSTFVVIHLQSNLIEKNKLSDIHFEMHEIQSEITESINSLDFIVDRMIMQIINKKLYNDPSLVISLLRKFHVTGKKSYLHLSINDMNWQDKNSNITVNKYGSLSNLNLPSAIDNMIKTSPKKSHLYEQPSNSSSENFSMFLSKAIIDEHNDYQGKINIQIDFDKWLQKMRNKLKNSGSILLMLNAEQ